MSKFLEILEQHDPANAENKNATSAVTWFLYDKELQFSSKGNKITLRTPEGYVVMEVLGFKKPEEQREVIVADVEEENQEKEIDIDSMADNAAQSYDQKSFIKKRLPTASNKGGKMVSAAVKDRAQILPKLASAVKKRTQTIKTQLQNYQSQV